MEKMDRIIGRAIVGLGMLIGFGYGLLVIFWSYSKMLDPKELPPLAVRIPDEVITYGFVIVLCGACAWMLIGQMIEAERVAEEVRKNLRNRMF